MKLFYSVLLTTTLLVTPFFTMAQKIYPTPQKVSINSNETYSVKDGVKIINNGADSVCINLLKQILPENSKSKYSIVINLKTEPNKGEIKGLKEAYTLKVNNKKIEINSNDDRGIYYALQTLRQIISDNYSIPSCTIIDYPTVKFRGVVEGFYGTPWSHRDRLAQFKFYGENKMNTYIYGPKDDPYHCSLAKNDGEAGWRIPYPEEDAKRITELALTARENKVDFVWAIHPGQDIKWNEEDYNNLINKLEHMYGLGVKSFAVFFDDIKGEGTDANKQAELLNKINRQFVRVKGDVTPLILCPTEYNKSWANPKPDGYLPILGKNLDKDIQIMWTGDKVCADITMETLNWVNERIERPAYIWWNYPVTDYVKNVVLQGPAKGITKEASAMSMSGFVSNPMEHAESSKIALFGVADYTWNPAKYDYLTTWDAAIKNIMPNISEAYRTFAIHSSQIEYNAHGYYMDESWETKNVTSEDFSNLSIAAKLIKEKCENPYLLKELTPWLNEAILLGNRGVKAFKMIDLYNEGNLNGAWNAYLDCGMTESQLEAYNNHKVGLKTLQPFIDSVRKEISSKIYEKLSNKKAFSPSPITSFNRTETLHFINDGNSATHFNSFTKQNDSCWVGLDLGEAKLIQSVLIEQGRNENDSYYMRNAVVECSLDGINWDTLKVISEKTYKIITTDINRPLKYIRLKATKENKTESRLAVRKIEVETEGNINSSLLIYGTGRINFTGKEKVTILSSNVSGGKVRAIYKDGTIKDLGVIEESFTQFILPSATEELVALEFEGSFEIFEVI